MAINDFSTLIQLSATLSIAFVAVDYARSYTSELCDRLLGLNDYIKNAFEECVKELPDEDTLAHLNPVNINGQSTNDHIEAVKRKRETMNKAIDEKKSEMINKISSSCHAGSLSVLCFFIFLFDVILLVLGGLEPTHQNLARIMMLFFGALSVLYIVIGWTLGENENVWNGLRYHSLHHPIICAVTFAVLALIFYLIVSTWFLNDYLSNVGWISDWIIFSCAVLPYINFVVFVFKVRGKALGFKKEVENAKGTLMGECREIKQHAADLIGSNRLVDSLQAR